MSNNVSSNTAISSNDKQPSDSTLAIDKISKSIVAYFGNAENKIPRSYPKYDLTSNSSLRAETLCPRPPETTLVVDGGIFSVVKRLKEIKEEINLINGSAFNKSLLTDAQHYQLLDVEMFIDDFIAPYSYKEQLK